MNDPHDPCATTGLHKIWRNQLGSDAAESQRPLLSSLGYGNEPVVVMLTCSELGNAPRIVTHAQPGEVMVVQNLAGIVSPLGQGEPDLAVASIGYALTIPTVRHLVVCGHRRCRVVPELLSDRRPELFADFREIVAEIREDLVHRGHWLSSEARHELAVEQVVLQQLRHLQTHPEIRQRIDCGDLLLHGWMYDERAAAVERFDPRSGRFCRNTLASR